MEAMPPAIPHKASNPQEVHRGPLMDRVFRSILEARPFVHRLDGETRGPSPFQTSRIAPFPRR